jgi:hypothetical protein
MSNTISKVHNNKHFSLDVSQHKKYDIKIKYHHIKSMIKIQDQNLLFVQLNLYALIKVGYSECFQQFWGPKSYFYTQVRKAISYGSNGKERKKKIEIHALINKLLT